MKVKALDILIAVEITALIALIVIVKVYGG